MLLDVAQQSRTSRAVVLRVLFTLVCFHRVANAQFDLGAEVGVSSDVSSSSYIAEEDVEVGGEGSSTAEEVIKAFLRDFDSRVEREFPGLIEKKWTYYTNITEENRQKKVEAEIRQITFKSEVRRTAQTYYHTYQTQSIPYELTRQLEVISSTSGSPTLTDVSQELHDVKSRMEQRYLTARVCRDEGNPSEETCLPLEPDLKQIMAHSRNTSELMWAWQGWRNVAGATARRDFERYVELSNRIARRSGFQDHGDYWRRQYDMRNMQEVLEDLFNQLKPLYQNLHAFIRGRLYQIYGSDVVDLNGPIPAHLLGGMWSHSWSNLFEIVKPHRTYSVDTSRLLRQRGYNARRMFETTNNFYTSMGLAGLPPSFWENSVFEKLDGREMSCEPSSWDFKDGRDFRVITCTNVTLEGMSKVHNLVGQTQYQYQYRTQPVALRQPANPAMYEALADLTSSEVYGPAYLRRIGILEGGTYDREIQLNALMKTALDSLALLPYAYAVDLWRWGVFNGSITPDEYNSKWWELRAKYEGIAPPVNRTEADFDPGAEFNVAADVSFVRYMLGLIMKFQFQKSLCEASGHRGPIHTCTLYGNLVAGQRLAAAMELGKSRSWIQILYLITNQYGIDVSVLNQHYQPLNTYLEEQNQKYGFSPGWTRPPATTYPTRSPEIEPGGESEYDHGDVRGRHIMSWCGR